MIDTQEMLEVITKVTGIADVRMEDQFAELGVDSTQVIEILIEYEILYAIDILDDQLNLDELTAVKDVYDYIAHLAGEERAPGKGE